MRRGIDLCSLLRLTLFPHLLFPGIIVLKPLLFILSSQPFWVLNFIQRPKYYISFLNGILFLLWWIFWRIRWLMGFHIIMDQMNTCFSSVSYSFNLCFCSLLMEVRIIRTWIIRTRKILFAKILRHLLDRASIYLIIIHDFAGWYLLLIIHVVFIYLIFCTILLSWNFRISFSERKPGNLLYPWKWSKYCLLILSSILYLFYQCYFFLIFDIIVHVNAGMKGRTRILIIRLFY